MAIDQKKLAAALDRIEAHAKTVNTGVRFSKVCTPYDATEFSFPAADKPRSAAPARPARKPASVG